MSRESKSYDKSGNPTLKYSLFEQAGSVADQSQAMTVNGTIGKVGILLALVVVGAAFTWNLLGTFNHGLLMPLTIGGAVLGFILALVISFKSKTAPYLSPFYALAQGAFLGGISVVLNAKFPGIAFEVICLTLLITTLMLILYRFRVIKATEKFRSVIILATAGIAIFYVISFILSFFGVYSPLYLSSTAPLWLTVGISLVVIVIASLNLILDFNFIEVGADYQAPKYLEWYGAFGLMVTLVWLYLEILKLLARLANR